MKFRDQHDKYSCAPIAFINALRWMGFKNVDDGSQESLQTYWKIFDTRTNGTDIKSIISRMNHLDVAESSHTRPSLKKLDSELKKGKAAIITYWGVNIRGNEYGHAMLCTGKIRGHYKVINCSNSKPSPVQYIRPGLMKRFLKYMNPNKIPSRVWFVKRINNG